MREIKRQGDGTLLALKVDAPRSEEYGGCLGAEGSHWLITNKIIGALVLEPQETEFYHNRYRSLEEDPELQVEKVPWRTP